MANTGTLLDGKVVIDITNPITDFTGFLTPEGSSGAQEIAKATSAGTHVVKAFNTLGLRPPDTGQLAMARALENATLLHLGLVAHSVKDTNFFRGVNILS